MSGLSRTPGKRVWVNPHRGFESLSFRQHLLDDRVETPSTTARDQSYLRSATSTSPRLLPGRWIGESRKILLAKGRNLKGRVGYL